MRNPYQIIWAILIIVLGSIVYLEANRPIPVNWAPSYHRNDKIPLGTYVLYNELSTQYRVTPVETTPYIFTEESHQGNYVFINNRLRFDKDEFHRLMEWASQGNTVFLAANHFSSTVLDSLQLSVGQAYNSSQLLTQPRFSLVNPHWANDSSYTYIRNQNLYFFDEIDTTRHIVLGEGFIQDSPQKAYVNYLKIPQGKGQILVHTMPQSFSNYFILLDNHHPYAENALTYLDAQHPVYWDAYYKTGKKVNTSPLHILLHNKYLKWAYYLLIIGSLCYVFFEGKRKQRSIQVIPPVKNQTYAYTQTIAQLHLDQKNHQGIIQKQIEQFFYYLRTQLHIEIPSPLHSEFYVSLASRTAHPIHVIQELFDYISTLQQKEQPTQEDVIELATRIQQFKK